MPIPSSINDLSTTAGSNSPAGSESPSTIDDYLRVYASYIAQLRDAAQSNGFSMATAGGSANAITATYSPPVTTLSDSTVLIFKATAANTGATTFSPNGLTAKPVVGAAHGALVGGEIIATGEVCVQYNSSIGGGSWVILYSTGAAGGVINQTLTAFTTAGTAPAFTLTPVPALGAYAAPQRFHVKFHAAGAGSDTLNVSTLGAKSLKQYDSLGAKVAAVIVAGQSSDVIYDGTDMVIMDPLPAPFQKQIQPVTAAVAANALTLTLNPNSLDFRSATLGSGTVNTRTIASAISLVVPSGATLGTVNATTSRLILLAIDNAGTVELAVVNLAGGNNLEETTLISTTAISAGATAANVIYSTTARSNVPYRVVGFVESTQATAGSWATAPSTIQGVGGEAVTSMSSFGFGQTYQDMTASRTIGGNNFNLTSKPIFVEVLFSSTSAGQLAMTPFVGSYSLGQTTYLVNAAFFIHSRAFIVPPFCAYSVTSTGSSTVPVLSKWSEMRA